MSDVTTVQKTALSNARRAVLAMSDEPAAIVSGSIREIPGGFEVRFSTEAGVYLVRTAIDGTVETVTEQQVH